MIIFTPIINFLNHVLYPFMSSFIRINTLGYILGFILLISLYSLIKAVYEYWISF